MNPLSESGKGKHGPPIASGCWPATGACRALSGAGAGRRGATIHARNVPQAAGVVGDRPRGVQCRGTWRRGPVDEAARRVARKRPCLAFRGFTPTAARHHVPSTATDTCARLSSCIAWRSPAALKSLGTAVIHRHRWAAWASPFHATAKAHCCTHTADAQSDLVLATSAGSR